MSPGHSTPTLSTPHLRPSFRALPPRVPHSSSPNSHTTGINKLQIHWVLLKWWVAAQVYPLLLPSRDDGGLERGAPGGQQQAPIDQGEQEGQRGELVGCRCFFHVVFDWKASWGWSGGRQAGWVVGAGVGASRAGCSTHPGPGPWPSQPGRPQPAESDSHQPLYSSAS